ncbi:hypothetical protein TNCV_1843751 [Trichonephila clavipes]|nr:hypothetical protein TNCV_1843751 [Trichonephila clavipes]
MHPIMLSYPLQFCVHGSSWNLLGRGLVDDLCQLKHSRVPGLPHNLSERTPIMLLENYARTPITSFREDLSVIPTFESL